MSGRNGAAKRHRRLCIRRCETHLIRPTAPRPQRRDCQGQLLARLRAMAGPAGTITQATMRPWCSATFVGAQHRLVLKLTGSDANMAATALATALSEADFALHGHIVADVVVDALLRERPDSATLVLAILTIEDW